MRREPSWRASPLPSRRGSRLLVLHSRSRPRSLWSNGIPVGMPGERMVEHGVDDEGLENLLMPYSSRKTDR
jgi:hypothetical protein